MKIPFVPPLTSRFINAENFECKFPDNIRTAILNPPPRIAGRPLEPVKEPSRDKCWPYFLLLLGMAAVLCALIGWSTSQRKPVHGQVSAPESVTTPTPAIIPLSDTAPRAVLVKLPPPRAQLVRLPEWRVGEERQLLLPSGLKVLGRLRGSLAATSMLPGNGELGDTYAIGENLWVWLVVPGTASGQWIDP
jgi:hypothetical protein